MKNDIMMDYIREQAEIIDRLLKNRKQIVKPFVEHLKKYPVKRIYFSGPWFTVSCERHFKTHDRTIAANRSVDRNAYPFQLSWGI